jgi:hypothetical protein
MSRWLCFNGQLAPVAHGSRGFFMISASKTSDGQRPADAPHMAIPNWVQDSPRPHVNMSPIAECEERTKDGLVIPYQRRDP